MDKAEIQLVDYEDRPVGIGQKLEVHQQGLLHRAFSVFVWRQNGNERELLLHQRAPGKYHSGGLWTNSCCSHPAPGEALPDAARRRLAEELGLVTDAPLKQHGFFIYRAQVGSLIEFELDHVLSLQQQEVSLAPDPEEISDWCWQPLSRLQQDLISTPERFTRWLPLALARFLRAQP